MTEKIIKDFSIIIPVYCNEGSLVELYSQLEKKVFQENINYSGDVIFCDDGSSDKSFEVLMKLKTHNDNIKIIRLSRNFGQTAAIYAGLSISKSKSYIIISADLQDPVELINDFLDLNRNHNHEIVIGVRSARSDPIFSRITASIAFWLMKKVNFDNFPGGGFDFVLISERIKNILLDRYDSNPFWQGEILWTGFKPKFIKYKRISRAHGVSKWSISKKITYFIDGVLGFSFLPIRLMSLCGLIIASSGFIYAIYILFARIFTFGEMAFGWAPLMIVILLIGGFQMLFLGIMGEYIWRTLSQTRERPNYIIKEIIGND